MNNKCATNNHHNFNTKLNYSRGLDNENYSKTFVNSCEHRSNTGTLPGNFLIYAFF